MSNYTQLEKLADRLLLVLRKQPDKPHTPAELSRKLKTSYEEIIAAVLRLEEWGYQISTTKKGAMSFRSAPDLLTETEIALGLKTKLIGRHIFAFGKVTSTNEIALQLAEAGVYDGTVVTAEEQTHGRGRLGRSWYSPHATGIYVSIILRPKIRPEQAPGISLITALALADILAEHCPGEVKVKWPNDVLIAGRKVAGILTELSADGSEIGKLIVGVGINVNQKAGDFPAEIRRLATSVRRASGKKAHRVSMLQKFLVRFEKEYLKYTKYGLEKSRSRLKGYSSLLGNEVILVSGEETISGRAIDIDGQGRLIIKTRLGTVPANSGEVTVITRKASASEQE